MLKLYLVRHSKTFGNTKKRYIGITDEPLCEEGIALAKGKRYPKMPVIFVSPMKRCMETAQILYPDSEYLWIEEFRECNFGEFENKNYLELEGNAHYQEWVDSDGRLPFPGGESQQEFAKRVLSGWEEMIALCEEKELEEAAVVAHGGTIMTIMEAYAEERKEFYQWWIENADGYEVLTDGKIITEIRRLSKEE